ncbi:hypothetical protein [Porphyromonas endodontalis]
MRIEELRIGDLVVEIGKPDRVYKVISLAVVNDTDVHVVDVETEAESQMFSADELELSEYRYKLAPWVYYDEEDVYTATTSDILDTNYCIRVSDYYNKCSLYVSGCDRFDLIGEYPSVESAKEAAEKHFNNLMEKLIKEVTE